MKKLLYTFFICAMVMFIGGVTCDALVPYDKIELGKNNYDENGELSFGYSVKAIYERVFIAKDIKESEINSLFTLEVYDENTKANVQKKCVFVKYGTKDIYAVLPKTLSIPNAQGVNEDLPVTWGEIPEGALLHPAGFEFQMDMTTSNGTEKLLVFELPCEKLNTLTNAEGLSFKKQNDRYVGETATGYFKKLKNRKIFVLGNGSRLVNGCATFDNDIYCFTADGMCRYNEYYGGYYYGSDGKRGAGKSYSWTKEGGIKYYADQEGNKVKLCYAFIDEKLYFFDGMGRLRQTFEESSYDLSGGKLLMGVLNTDTVSDKKIMERLDKIRKKAKKKASDKNALLFVEISNKELKVVKDKKIVSKVRGAKLYTYNLEAIRIKSGEGKLTKKNSKQVFKYFNGKLAEEALIEADGKIYYCDYYGEAKKFVDGMEVTYGGVVYRIKGVKFKNDLMSAGHAEAVKLAKSSLQSVYVTDVIPTVSDIKVTVIAPSFVKGNRRLLTAKIGENVTTIGKDAFKGCTSLANVFFDTAKLKVSTVENAFSNGKRSVAVYVPAKKAEAYKEVLRKLGVGYPRITKM